MLTVGGQATVVAKATGAALDGRTRQSGFVGPFTGCRVSTARTMLNCTHCLVPCVRNKRGLCNRCYTDPIIRSIYPSTAPRGLGSHNKCRGLAPEPCTAPPGSEQRIITMQMRAALGYAIFHPDDAVATLD